MTRDRHSTTCNVAYRVSPLLLFPVLDTFVPTSLKPNDVEPTTSIFSTIYTLPYVSSCCNRSLEAPSGYNNGVQTINIRQLTLPYVVTLSQTPFQQTLNNIHSHILHFHNDSFLN